MNFNAAINPFTAPSFKEGCKLASIRDNRNVGKSWLKDREMARNLENTNAQLRKVGREVAKARRRIVGGFVPTETELMFPFKIYNIQNVSATAAQVKQFTDLNLDINNYTFQIRNGMLGCRTYINFPQLSVDGPLSACVGNYELILSPSTTDDSQTFDLIQSNGYNIENFYQQPVPNTGTTLVLDNLNKTLICDGTTFNSQIALNPAPQTGPGLADPSLSVAAFWFEIVDDPANGIIVKLWGQMSGTEIDSNRNLNPIPQGPNIVPIGEVAVQGANAGLDITGTSTTNYLSGNAINRFPPGCSNTRGRWNDLYAALPAGKTHLVWYPGDVTVDTTTPITDVSGFTYFKTWQLGGTTIVFNTVSQSPSIGTGWIEVGIST